MKHVIGVRPHLIGDSLMSLVVPSYLKMVFPEIAAINWVIAAKCAQSAPLYFNHPAIDRILIAQGERYEGLEEIVQRCDTVFNPTPQHPEGDIWPNRRNIYEETWLMSGLPLSLYNSLTPDQQVPHLVQWFKTERHPKCIALWPGSRQGEKENRRNPPYEWWAELAEALTLDGYTIYQCGHPNDLKGYPLLGIDARKLGFLELVQLSLGCDLAIGTDSGSMIALAAYRATPTISLLSPHWPNHVENPTAFGPLGKHHTNLWAPSNREHSVEMVLDKVRSLT